MPPPSLKYRIVHAVQQRALNPPVRFLLGHGLPAPGYVLLETTGRRTGRPRRTPVGDGRVGDVLWIVAEHGERAAYVRNIRADPHVRVRLRDGWHEGVATVLLEDDARRRQRWLARRRPATALNALVVRLMGTALTTVRVDLAADPVSAAR
jgi:deazaflavin-dependent oxidoreductase (nitroreductase family)